MELQGRSESSQKFASGEFTAQSGFGAVFLAH